MSCLSDDTHGELLLLWSYWSLPQHLAFPLEHSDISGRNLSQHRTELCYWH